MARQPTTRLQVSGYRFLVRRMEHALLRGDIEMLHPVRTQSLSFIGGCVLAVIVAAGCAILAYLRPDAALGDAPIVMSRDGALYARSGDALHPVLNLASARLIAGSDAKPKLVDAGAIGQAKRGPLLGIPGAPAAIGKPLGDDIAWTVCDGATTTMIAGPPKVVEQAQPAVLVTPRSESAATTYLLYDGWRAEVDLRNPAVVWALRLDSVEPRPVSRILLDAIPEAPPIAPPHVPGLGSPGAVAGQPVGTVIRVPRVDANDYFVVLADGVQRVGEVAADLIRIAGSQSGRDVVSLSPGGLAGVPVVDTLPVSALPRRAGTPRGKGDGVLCAQWLNTANTSLWLDDSSPASDVVDLAQADGDGPNLDTVVIPAGRSAYVRATSLTGKGRGKGPLYLVTDSGVLFGIRDEDAAAHLGLGGSPATAPWPVLSRLPRGPELSREAALIAHDGIGAPP
ncbi:type VII secretion protein EccB [Mycolicibacterium agri]|uniref:Type VII secretion protein EccB n=1 Tax=Mycolicibacterium agri TaxID=36811 RepID=A0A2A7MYL8_MYCAG|nr:type VII secretion protein EccB [Mycolicibacterium agri]PEG36597.1 type VII secretion protein EccB [Mycolicibacterium agri]GFG51982.1 hypothetical protein MAGR_34230 [Mycolicibacterium agri]